MKLTKNVQTSLNDLKTIVDVVKLKTVLVDLKKLSDAIGNELVENTKFITIKTKG